MRNLLLSIFMFSYLYHVTVSTFQTVKVVVCLSLSSVFPVAVSPLLSLRNLFVVTLFVLSIVAFTMLQYNQHSPKALCPLAHRVDIWPAGMCA